MARTRRRNGRLGDEQPRQPDGRLGPLPVSEISRHFHQRNGKKQSDHSSVQTGTRQNLSTGHALVKHFKAAEGGGILGLHSASRDGASRWFALDIDLHEEDDLSVSPEGNFVAAVKWYERLLELGFDPLLMDSNGAGGFHLLVMLSKPMATKSVRQFCGELVSDFARLGLDKRPDLFPGSLGTNSKGSWLRLPGRHHTRQFYTRVYNDEPWTDQKWIEGHEAIDRILAL